MIVFINNFNMYLFILFFKINKKIIIAERKHKNILMLIIIFIHINIHSNIVNDSGLKTMIINKQKIYFYFLILV